MKSPIVQRIQKLLSLATSSNEHEARSAAEQASRLLVKHNLKRQDVDQRDYDVHQVTQLSRRPTEWKFTLPIVRKHFFVETIRSRSSGAVRLTFVGEPENVEIAAYVFEFLNREFQSCWKAYAAARKLSASARQAYYMGLYLGLDAQLKSAASHVQQTEGLVLVRDPGISLAVRKAFPRVKSTSGRRIPVRDAQAKADGEAKGRELQIRRGLASSSSNTTAKIGSGNT